MSLTALPPSPPPLLESAPLGHFLFFGLPAMSGTLPAELKFGENPVKVCHDLFTLNI